LPRTHARLAVPVIALSLLAGSVALTSPAVAASKKTPKLDILVSNDDGVTAEGIAVLVDALRELPNVRVVVAAPATNQTATGGSTSSSPVTAAEASTATGYEATAVNGFPSDSVIYGLDNVMTTTPNLVVTGINEGQNLGGVTELSGTIGAARAAAARGIPALAVSAHHTNPDYATAAELAVDWVAKRRTQLSKKPKQPILLESLNVPTCPELRGVARTTIAPTLENSLAEPDCASKLPKPTDDITAYVNGYASLSRPSVTAATSAAS
jgi:5'-nucleotidase